MGSAGAEDPKGFSREPSSRLAKWMCKPARVSTEKTFCEAPSRYPSGISYPKGTLWVGSALVHIFKETVGCELAHLCYNIHSVRAFIGSTCRIFSSTLIIEYSGEIC